MPLDNEIEAVLKQLNKLTPLHKLTVSEARAQFRLPPGGSGPVCDVQNFLHPNGFPMRLYHPSSQSRLPLVVYMHGGGWIMGDLDTHDVICRDLAVGGGVALLAVDYRLAPEFKFPAASDDCLAATRWAYSAADGLMIDPRAIAIMGESAGGTLAAVTALRIREEGGPRLCAQLLVCPALDYHTPASRSYLEFGDGYYLTRADMIWFWHNYLAQPNDTEHPNAVPARAGSLVGLPPTMVITAEYDPLRDEAEAFAERLAKSSVPTKVVRYDGVIHGFFRMGRVSKTAREAVYEAGTFLQQSFSDALAVGCEAAP